MNKNESAKAQLRTNYQVGGSLHQDATTYTVRKADAEIFQALMAGDFCYVLNSRQMGKSSLRVQTMQRLTNAGVACGCIDFTLIGKENIPIDMWYASLIVMLVGEFKLSGIFDEDSWFRETERIAPLLGFGKFIEEVLLEKITENIVIFFDEIDSIIKVEFKDDFFAFIRACYNKRAENPAYNRLSFCLLGVATPSDLIQDKQRTPFNIGRDIELTGFTFEEAQKPLLPGLVGRVDNPEAVLGEVLKWTGGQPFLTQKLCRLMVEVGARHAVPVESVARSRIIDNWVAHDQPEHLKTIRDRLLRNEERAGRLLGLYQQVLDRGSVVADGSEEQTELRLSGLVVQRDGCLRVNNRIYGGVFNRLWVEEEFARLRPYSEAFTAWVESGCSDESRLLRGEALRDASRLVQWEAFGRFGLSVFGCWAGVGERGD